MTPLDLLKFNPCNLDHLTETYNIGFYLDYFRQWPQLCKVIEGPSGQIEAYSESQIMEDLQDRSLTWPGSSWESRSITHPSTHRPI